jgi:hypothetical protein
MSHFNEMPLPFLIDEATTAKAVGGKQPSYIADHRQRLRARFMAGSKLPRAILKPSEPVKREEILGMIWDMEEEIMGRSEASA